MAGCGLGHGGGGFWFQPFYQEEAALSFTGRHTARRFDPASRVRWRKSEKTSSHDLRDNSRRHVGVDAAFHDHGAHSSVTNRQGRDENGFTWIVRDVVDDKDSLRVGCFQSC